MTICMTLRHLVTVPGASVRPRSVTHSWTGKHRQYKHPRKRGVVTIAGKPSRDLPPGLERSILKQAGLMGEQQ